MSLIIVTGETIQKDCEAKGRLYARGLLTDAENKRVHKRILKMVEEIKQEEQRAEEQSDG